MARRYPGLWLMSILKHRIQSTQRTTGELSPQRAGLIAPGVSLARSLKALVANHRDVGELFRGIVPASFALSHGLTFGAPSALLLALLFRNGIAVGRVEAQAAALGEVLTDECWPPLAVRAAFDNPCGIHVAILYVEGKHRF
jgi:hypothetical protein